MTHYEILEEAVKKAKENGWEPTNINAMNWGFSTSFPGYTFRTGADFIFNHDFAKALWGNFYPVSYTSDGGVLLEDDKINKDAWRYHLQRMVIADDPIEYLGQNI